jgi:hypothetical protein
MTSQHINLQVLRFLGSGIAELHMKVMQVVGAGARAAGWYSHDGCEVCGRHDSYHSATNLVLPLQID